MVVSIISEAKAVPQEPLCYPILVLSGPPATHLVIRSRIGAGGSNNVHHLPMSRSLLEVVPLVRSLDILLPRIVGQAIVVMAQPVSSD